MAGMAQTTSDGLSRSEIQPELSYANLLSSQGKPKLEVCNLFKSYGKQGKQLTVLENVNLQLYPREFVCIVGASGCGKSTLLNIIAGLVPPTSGEVRVDNDVILGPGSDRGMVFR